MKVYGLTKLGWKIASTKYEDTEEFKVLSYLKDNKTGTSSELEIIGGESYVLRKLKERGLIQELTT